MENNLDLIITNTYDELSQAAFNIWKNIAQLEKPKFGMATGSTPIGLYEKIVIDHDLNGTCYENAQFYNLDEYAGLEREHEQSYYYFMQEHLFKKINAQEKNLFIPWGAHDDIELACKTYQAIMENTHVDLQLLGLGSNGHIGFNEPGTPFDSITHHIKLTEETKEANARFFERKEEVPTHAITMGIK